MSGYLELFGSPTKSYLKLIKDKARRHYIEAFLNKNTKQKRNKISKLLKNTEKSIKKIINEMLCFDYRNRITVEKALKSPIFEEFHKENVVKVPNN